MKRAIFVFGAIGGLGVPLIFALLGWGLRTFAPEAHPSLRDVELPLWPMSTMFADDPSGRHWLYLPLAAILSNALIYAAIGAMSAWGRSNIAAFGAALLAAIAILVAVQQAFGTGPAGLVIAAALAVTGLWIHHRIGRGGQAADPEIDAS